ncbi:MAG TPA: DUF1194 domain-containing protein [Micropepsaceae bacterium]|nr:DUF1194 domain-containing protein [Micropepsaceae bacterium]
MRAETRGNMFRGRMKLALLGVLVAALATLPAPAQPTGSVKVDVKLVIATDVSLSINDEEEQLEREGIAEVFLDPDVVKAIKGGALGRIAVAMLDWSSPNYDRVVLDWTFVEDEASATALAEKVRTIPRTPGTRTSISGALERATLMLNESDGKIVATRKVIDVSGDGPNNDGVSLQHIHDTTANNGITVNGLPIMDENAEGYVPDLDQYYAACVVAGKGSFLVVVKKFKDFGAAMRRKLVLEISQNQSQIRQTLGELQANPLLKRIAAGDSGPASQAQIQRPAKTYPGGCDKYGGWGYGGF